MKRVTKIVFKGGKDNGKLQNDSVAEESSVVQTEGKRQVRRNLKIYNLDMVILVGYRVHLKRGIAFRRWVNNVLKDYLIQCYAINEKRINVFNKTIDIQNRMLAYSIDIDKKEQQPLEIIFKGLYLFRIEHEKETIYLGNLLLDGV